MISRISKLVLAAMMLLTVETPAKACGSYDYCPQYCYGNDQCPVGQVCRGGSDFANTPGICSPFRSSENKALVESFYDLAINQHLPRRAADLYIGTKYIQHNPLIADGKQAFVDFFEARFKEFPNIHGDIKRVLSDGDLVILHVHSRLTPDDRGRAIVDIFRMDAGRIVEHWDVIQAIPETSANNNGMF